MDLVIDELIIEKDRPKHIAEHGVTVKEVLQVVRGDYVFIQGKYERWILIGKTKKKRILAIVIGVREKKHTYGLVTARSAHKTERSLYKEISSTQGGENEDESNAA